MAEELLLKTVLLPVKMIETLLCLVAIVLSEIKVQANSSMNGMLIKRETNQSNL